MKATYHLSVCGELPLNSCIKLALLKEMFRVFKID